MLSKPAIGLAVVAVGASVYVKYYGFPDLQQQPASVQAELERAASMRTGEPMVLILGTHRVVGNPLGQLLVKVAVWKASTNLPTAAAVPVLQDTCCSSSLLARSCLNRVKLLSAP